MPALLLCLLLSCQQQGKTDLTSQLLYTASGTYDSQADQRKREERGVRSVQWRTRPPVPAQTVTAKYDSDARSVAWQVTIQKPTFNSSDLKGETMNVTTPSGPGTLFTAGRLKGVLYYQSGSGEFTFMTHAWAEQHAPAYAPAFSQGN